MQTTATRSLHIIIASFTLLLAACGSSPSSTTTSSAATGGGGHGTGTGAGGSGSTGMGGAGQDDAAALVGSWRSNECEGVLPGEEAECSLTWQFGAPPANGDGQWDTVRTVLTNDTSGSLVGCFYTWRGKQGSWRFTTVDGAPAIATYHYLQTIECTQCTDPSSNFAEKDAKPSADHDYVYTLSGDDLTVTYASTTTHLHRVP